MNEIIFSRLCYLVANPEEAFVRLRYMSEDMKEYISLLVAYTRLRENIKKLLDSEHLPSYLEGTLNANDSYMETLSNIIERDFNKKAIVREDENDRTNG